MLRRLAVFIRSHLPLLLFLSLAASQEFGSSDDLYTEERKAQEAARLEQENAARAAVPGLDYKADMARLEHDAEIS